jgi:hypothetical protein
MKHFYSMLSVAALVTACGGSPAPEPETAPNETAAEPGEDAPASEPGRTAEEPTPEAPPRDTAPAPAPAEQVDFADRDGAAEALRDIASGALSLKTFGYPAPARFEYGKLLEAELGVKLDAVAGCVVTEALIDFVREYNAVMEDHLEAKHGADVLEKLWRRAEETLGGE